ncbi:MAG: hypothetical protein CMH54_12965 [Myxococcales bacterium]|nr:hypothetical protein [Myxococcales bacterium]
MHIISIGHRLALTVLIVTAFLFSATAVTAAPPTIKPNVPSNAKRGKYFVPKTKSAKKARKRGKSQRYERSRSLRDAKKPTMPTRSRKGSARDTRRSPDVKSAPTKEYKGTVPKRNSRSVKSRKDVRSKRVLPRKGQLRPKRGPAGKGPVPARPDAPIRPGKK